MSGVWIYPAILKGMRMQPNDEALFNGAEDLAERTKQRNIEGRALKDDLIRHWSRHSRYATPQLYALLGGLRVRTFGGQQYGGFEKATLCCSLGDQLEYEAAKIVSTYPLVYLGSADDVGFALCLRFRQIYLVDPYFAEGESSFEEIRETLRAFPDFSEEESADDIRIFRCTFNFGHDSGEVCVACVPLAAADFSLPADTLIGGIISYQTGEQIHPLMFPQLCSQLVEGGVVYHNTPFIIEDAANIRCGITDTLPPEMNSDTLSVFRETTTREAEGFGFETTYFLPGMSTPYYRRRGQGGADFIQRIEDASTQLQHRRLQLAESAGAVRAIPSAY
jgi:hypothetical protein